MIKLFLLPSFLSFTFTLSFAQGSQPPKLIRTHKSWGNASIKIAPIRLPASRWLVTIGDTLYLLNAQQTVIWKWDVGNGQDIMDRPILDSHGNIYGIADDGIAFSLDQNGQERWRWQMNGSAYFTRLMKYGKDHYLLLSAKSATTRAPNDPDVATLSLCKDRDVVGWAIIPRRAAIRVRGRRIYVTTKSKQGLRTREVRFH